MLHSLSYNDAFMFPNSLIQRDISNNNSVNGPQLEPGLQLAGQSVRPGFIAVTETCTTSASSNIKDFKSQATS